MKRHLKYFEGGIPEFLVDRINIYAKENQLNIIQIEYVTTGVMVLFERKGGVE